MGAESWVLVIRDQGQSERENEEWLIKAVNFQLGGSKKQSRVMAEQVGMDKHALL